MFFTDEDYYDPIITPLSVAAFHEPFPYLPVINGFVIATILPVCPFNVWEQCVAHADLTLTMNRNTAAARRSNGTVVYH